MKKIISHISTAAILLGSLALATPAAAAQPAAPGQNKLTCSVDAPATCTVTKSGTTATLDTNSGGAAAVYLAGFNTSFYGVRVGQVTKLSNTYTGTPGVDPHWSIPIDLGGIHDGFTDYFVFVSFSTCNNGAGLVDIINDPTCTIYDGRNALVSYPNWLAFTQANTNDYISLNDYYAFIIADSSQAGPWTVSNMIVGKPGK